MSSRTHLSTLTQAQIIQEAALLRLYQIIGDPNRGIAPLLPVSRTTFLNGVKTGKYPKPIKHGRSSFWRATDIRQMLATLSGGQ